MKYIHLPCTKLEENAIVPTYSHDGDAGLDLYANEDVMLPGALSGDRNFAAIGTGIAVDIPLGYVGLVHPRSGMAANNGLTVLNAPGTVDTGYRGELKVILINHARTAYRITAGDRIAQLVLQDVCYANIHLVDNFEGFTARETAGLGSTGA